MSELSELTFKAKTKEDIKAVWNSKAFQQASGIEVVLANIVLGFAYIRCELDDIKTELEEIKKKMGE